MLKRVGLGEVVSKELLSLRILGCGEIHHVDLLTEAVILTTLSLELLVTQFVDDSLDSVIESLSVRAMLGKQSGSLVRHGKTILAAAVCLLCLNAIEALHHGSLHSELLLHVCHLATVCGDLCLREAVGNVHVDTSEACAQGLEDVSEPTSDGLLDASDAAIDHLVTEATTDLLGLVEPRIQCVTTDAACSTTLVATPVATTTPAQASEEHDNDDEPEGTIATTKAIIVILVDEST